MIISNARLKSLFLVLSAISAVAGYLLSKASLVGRAGINLFYKEYKFLRTGWQGALLVFVVLCIVLGIHYWVQKTQSASRRVLLHLVILCVGLAGLYLTYSDFRNTLSHRLLGERFHLGAYLFWAGWLATGATFLLSQRTPIERK